MIYIKSLKWGNWFSYGEDNEIDFLDNTLTQICGSNGAGKSSIPIILEETLFGKNSKGIKKADIPNRKNPKGSVTSSLTLVRNKDSYQIGLVRKSGSAKLTLIKNGVDISSHTATDTYKNISKILGLDYKLYSQLTYQSSTSSLQFLKATDTDRKKFLISLFNLHKYIDLHEIFKEEHKATSSKTTYILGKASTSKSWIDNNKDTDTEVLGLKEVPSSSNKNIDTLIEVKSSLLSIKKVNEEINKNNTYISKLSKIKDTDLVYPKQTPDKQRVISLQGDVKVKQADITRIKKQLVILESKSKDKKCPSCNQIIKAEDVLDLIKKNKEIIQDITKQTNEVSENLIDLNSEVLKYEKYKSTVYEFENLTNYIDDSLPLEILNESEILEEIQNLETEIQSLDTLISKTIAYNNKIIRHNAKVLINKETLKKHQLTLSSLYEESAGLQKQEAILDILKTSFSTSGLVSYKLEFVIKALEEEINSYLAELSSGRFQIVFILVKDKLNIEIVDGGVSINIAALSSGELARVNTSTVLAIRKLMSNISNTKINLLFLDEIMGVLDEEGKDVLVGVLMKEELNTMLVSHEFQHPLIPQILISKENNMSKVEKING